MFRTGTTFRSTRCSEEIKILIGENVGEKSFKNQYIIRHHYRRIAGHHRPADKRGFTNLFKECFAIINLQDLERFEDGATVDRKALLEAGLIKKKHSQVKLLGNGDVAKKFTIAVNKVSASARKKIEAAGGTIQE